MLNSIKTLKNYCKATFNMLFIEKILKSKIFFCQTETLLLNMWKLFKIPVLFCLNCQIPGFFRFQGKVATLFTILITKIFNSSSKTKTIYKYFQIMFWGYILQLKILFEKLIKNTSKKSMKYQIIDSLCRIYLFHLYFLKFFSFYT